MNKKTVYNYVIIRYRPNPFIDQFLNVGVVVIEAETSKIEYKIFENSEKINRVFKLKESYYEEMKNSMKDNIEHIKKVLPNINQLKPMKEYIQSSFRVTDSVLHFSEFKTAYNEQTLKQNVKRLYEEFVTVFV